LLIDEFAALTHKASEGANPLSELLYEFIAQYMRANRVFLTVCFQSLNQLPQDLQQTILRLGNLVVGRAGTMREARVLADVLFRTDPYKVKHYRKVWGKVDPPSFFWGGASSSSASFLSPSYPYFVLDYEPEYMALTEQQELAAQRITNLDRFEFLVRPATGEGSVSQFVSKVNIREVTIDPDTGESLFPDETLIRQLKSHLAKRGGIPVATIRAEQEARLSAGVLKEPGTTQALPPVASDVTPGEGAAAPRTATHRPPRKATPPPPVIVQLDDQERAFLSFLMEHPDTPISEVYQTCAISWHKRNQLRDSLTEQGFIEELEVRSGAGRPAKFFIPTLHAFELLGQEPPTGRGSVIHRHLQHLVTAGAIAKGYSAQVEKAIGTGGIVDVHLEREGVRIAVEIAVCSKPQLEIAHIQSCLAAGYDQVFGIFVDEHLLERTQSTMHQGFSAEEVDKVRLLPLRSLSGVG
jgi:hypothetical protein